MKRKVVVIGGGGHAKVIISIIKKTNEFELVGFTEKKKSDSILGTKYLGKDEILTELYEDGIKSAVIGIGHIRSFVSRKNIYINLKNIGFDLPVICSPNSIVNEDVFIEEGTVLMDGAIINSGSNIGKCCIINTNSCVDHDCKINDFTHIAPGASLSGNVKIASGSLIGVGSKIIQSVVIRERVIIGAGSLVLNSITKSGVYFGSPVKFIGDLDG